MVGYLVRSFPRLSQTFVLDEVLGLERVGVELRLFAMVDSGETLVDEGVARLRAPVVHLDCASSGRRAVAHLAVGRAAPARYLRTLVAVLTHRWDRGYRTQSRIRSFGQAVDLVHRLGQERAGGRDAPAVEHLHAHFAHDPALVALLVHRLSGVPFSFTAHARDLWQLAPAALVARTQSATAVVTCCADGRDHLLAVLPPTLHPKVVLVHHGVDLERFHPAPPASPAPTVPTILSVGRLVEKKGFADLVAAAARLRDDGHRFRLEIHGDGPLGAELAATVRALGLGSHVVLAGASTRAHLVEAYRRADLFALTPVVTDDGDRDGVPNVLVEAMACGLAVVTTSAGGITELVSHDSNGLLAPPRDPAAVAAHLAALLDDPARRAHLGAAARSTVEESYDAGAAATRMAGLLSPRGDAGRARVAEAVAPC